MQTADTSAACNEDESALLDAISALAWHTCPTPAPVRDATTGDAQTSSALVQALADVAGLQAV